MGIVNLKTMVTDWIRLKTQADDPATPASGFGVFYDKAKLPFYKNSDGTEMALSGGSGDVVGPASATADHLAVFDGTTGKLIKDGGAIPAGGYTQGARVYNSGNISVTDATPQALTFDSERYDTDTIHDTGTNPSRLTCKTAGVYMIWGGVQWASSTTGSRQLHIRFGGTTYIATNEASTVLYQQTSTIYKLAMNEYVELMAAQGSGGAINVTAAGNFSPEFAMQRIG